MLMSGLLLKKTSLSRSLVERKLHICYSTAQTRKYTAESYVSQTVCMAVVITFLSPVLRNAQLPLRKS